MSFRLKQVCWTAAMFIVAVLFWHTWVPDQLYFEAAGWDESDRARDALTLFLALRHFNLWALVHQLFLFETWGPLFAVFAQIPLACFGPSAHSLTFMSFFAMVFASGLSFMFVQRKLGWLAAVSTVAFAFTWIAGAQGFGPYWVMFMIDSWVVVAWLAIAAAGALGDADLLLLGSWLLFATKYQYYPIFFVSTVLYFGWHGRRKLLTFAKEFCKPTWSKAALAIMAVAVIHICVMKIFGPVYGQVSWNRPRALRNPVLFAFVLLTSLMYARRTLILNTFIKSKWEERFVKWFFWPATLLMAFPWPNRWAGVMVTQDADGISRSALALLRLYANDVARALTFPVQTTLVLMLLIISAIALAARKNYLSRFAGTGSPAVFAAVLFAIQTFILLFAVKNYQMRFIFAIFLTVPVALWIFILSELKQRLRTAVASVSIFAVCYILSTTVFFKPDSFFNIQNGGSIDATFREHPALYPLSDSLDPVVTQFAFTHKLSSMTLGILSKKSESWWDRPLQLWPSEYQIRTGILVSAQAYLDEQTVCADSQRDRVDLILIPSGAMWLPYVCER